MFKHILVPTDLTQRTEEAVRLALDMQRRCSSTQEEQGKVSLLYIIERVAEDVEEDFSDLYAELESKAWDKFEEIVPEPDVPVEKNVVIGHRVEEILRFISSQEVDLTILRSHRIDPQNPAEGWGTISHKVGILAPCPVMLVK